MTPAAPPPDPSSVIETLHTAKFLQLLKRGHWEYVHRPNATGAVAIVAITPAGELLLTEQFRIPLQAVCVELPAGIVGDDPAIAGESLEEGARRELLEETGYAAAHCEVLMTGPSSAGLATEVVALVKATGLRRVAEGGGVGDERIVTHHVPLAEVTGWLAERHARGVMADHRVYAALHFCGVGPRAGGGA